MIGRLNHVAIAVLDMEEALKVYRDTLGGIVSDKVAQPDHGVSTVFVELPNTKIELLEPLGENSPINKFLERNTQGGIHHICYEVDDIMLRVISWWRMVRVFLVMVSQRSGRTASQFCSCIQKTSSAR